MDEECMCAQGHFLSGNSLLLLLCVWDPEKEEGERDRKNGSGCGTVHVWKSEDNFGELIIFFHLGSNDWNHVTGLYHKYFYSLNLLSHRFTLTLNKSLKKYLYT